MNRAEVSILIPAYCADTFIEQALIGVSGQTFLQWELIVVEDGSKGATETIVKRFAEDHPDHRVVYERSEDNLGVSRTRNRLIELAEPDCFAFLDADDCWMPVHLEYGMDKLRYGAEFVVSGFSTRVLTIGEVQPQENPTKEQLEYPMDHLLNDNFIQCSSMVMMSRKGWNVSGPFDSRLRIGEDLDVWLRCISCYGLVHTGHHSCIYNKHENSAMADTKRVVCDRVAFLKKQRNHFKSAKAYYRQLADAYKNLGKLTWRSNILKGLGAFVAAVFYTVLFVGS